MMADWEEADWNSADATAEKVIAGIAQQVFWPPRYDLKYSDEELALICQDNVAGRVLAQVAAGGAA
jgi:hypothetical protein